MEDEASQAIAGDAIADALERKGGRRKRRFGWGRKPKKEAEPLTHCENCGTELRGHYCSNCGQAAVNSHRSFRHVIVDVLDAFLSWDSKFIRSLGLLLWRPGWLTNQFLEGRRVRFVHPLRLYLVVSIAFFLAARLIPMSESRTIKPEDLPPEARARYEEKMAKVREKQKKHGSLFTFSTDDKRKSPTTPAPAPSAPTVDSAAPTVPAAPPPVTSTESAADAEQPIAPQTSATPAEAQTIADQVMKELEAEKMKETAGPHVQFGPDKKRPKTPFELWLDQRVKEQIGENGKNAKLFLQTLRSNLSTMMLFCIPLFAFILKILYLRQKRFYIEHLVYALNIHAFFYLAAMLVVFISIGLARVTPGAPQVLLTLLLSLLVFVQVFISIRRVYRQSWFMSLFKFAFGGFIYLFVLALGVAATAFVTLALGA
ncbi:MAG: hypothetical protein DLM73_13750 [Chthoniobacterales bacterium]|nr:MAG: hypothetical protein DLM73_13750 [Chthoniobacterales bacterium]